MVSSRFEQDQSNGRQDDKPQFNESIGSSGRGRI